MDSLPGKKLPPWTPFINDCDDFAWNFIQFLKSKGYKNWSYEVSGGTWNHAYIDWKSPDGKTTYYFEPQHGKAYKEIPKDTLEFTGESAERAFNGEKEREDGELKKLEGWVDPKNEAAAAGLEKRDIIIVYDNNTHSLRLMAYDDYLKASNVTPFESYIYGKDFGKYKR